MCKETPICHSLAMIEERIREKLTVEALAASIHFSKYHYQRMFREAVGESVMRYVTRRKLILAAGELAETRDTILEIALRYGYDSHEGFTRSFTAYMGMTPAEYRKYHYAVASLRVGKEKRDMMYSKTTDEIIRELNSLIVEARETADHTRKHVGAMPEAKTFYEPVWNYAADRTEEMAGQMTELLERVGNIAGCPDGISARFLIVSAIENAAFVFSLTAFQTGLTMARAMPEHREAYEQMTGKYRQLARHARLKAEKIADFLSELAALIFQDMRKNAQERMREMQEAGRAAAEKLSNPALPYLYIVEEILGMTEKLSALSPEKVTVYELENMLFRLETVSFAAESDILRDPSHRELFAGISHFENCLKEALEFFRDLPEGAMGTYGKSEKEPVLARNPGKKYEDLAVQEEILLFYLKGEIQKLEAAHLGEEQTDALRKVCDELAGVAKACGHAADGGEEDIPGSLRKVYDEMMVQAAQLGVYGGAIRYIAEEVKAPLERM
ncbi:MAG: helix-turn-helix transcriptional regulator [Acetatifactor sp.]|nr:helix-turn-helix transcriptional regulator [Acetatifactor sp.]